MNFRDQINHKVATTSPLVVGIDPDLELMPRGWITSSLDSSLTSVPDLYHRYSLNIIEAVKGKVAAVKIQLAFFEALGHRGLEVVEKLIIAAHQSDLMVIIDGKRGDVPSTAKQYAQTYLGDSTSSSPLSGDALTVNPYLGMDSLEPFFELAEKSGKGIFVCLKTSNPGSGDLQDLLINDTPLHLNLARQLARFEENGSLGVVVGATYPETARAIRNILPQTTFLVPGMGKQGGSWEDSEHYYSADHKQALFSFSRSIIFPSLHEENISDEFLQEKMTDELEHQLSLIK